jgi:uncharacterized membrane protein YgdD (TMEM256/DUF423 family)
VSEGLRGGFRSPLAAAGAVNAILAIAAGAFGAHGLKERLDARRLEIFETAARYHVIGALGMMIAALLAAAGARMATTGGWTLQAGVAVFSGSLYALALTGVNGLGAITPFGGLGLMLGFLFVAIGCVRRA